MIQVAHDHVLRDSPEVSRHHGVNLDGGNRAMLGHQLPGDVAPPAPISRTR